MTASEATKGIDAINRWKGNLSAGSHVQTARLRVAVAIFTVLAILVVGSLAIILTTQGVPAGAPSHAQGSPIPHVPQILSGNGTNNNSLSVSISTNPSPATGPAPLTVGFLATVSGGTPPYGVNWTFANGVSMSGLNISYTFTNPGSYSVCGYAYDKGFAEWGSQCVNVTVTYPTCEILGGNSLCIVVQTKPSPPVGLVPLFVAFSATVTAGTSPYSVSWDFGANNSAGNQSQGSGLNANYTYVIPGTYLACGYATDQNGTTVSQCVKVDALPDNGSNGSGLTVMIATNPSPATGPAPLTVGFVAAVSGGPTVVSYTVNWSFGDNTPTVSGFNVTHTFNGAGSYIACAYATDHNGTRGSACVPVMVTGGNCTGTAGCQLSVVAQAVPLKGASPLSVNFWANVTGGIGPYLYEWAFGDGGNGSGSPIIHTYSSPGAYAVVVTVTDSSGQVVSASLTVDVLGNTSAGQPALSMVASPTSGPAPLPVNFTLKAGGGVAPYDLYLCYGDLSNVCQQTDSNWSGAPLTFSHTYTTQGDFTATAEIVDQNGNNAMAKTTVMVTNSTSLSAGLIVTPTSGQPTLDVKFLVTSVGGGTAPYKLTVSFGDSSGSSVPVTVGETVSHNYTSPGTYLAKVTVTDSAGEVATLNATIHVYASNATSNLPTGEVVGGAVAAGGAGVLGVWGGATLLRRRHTNSVLRTGEPKQ